MTGSVNVVALQPNGQILVAGSISGLSPNGALTTTTRYNLARLNADGTVDPTFAPQPNEQVLAIALQPNGQIVIGGNFTSIQANGAAMPTTRNCIARLNSDGSLDTTFDPNAHGTYISQVNAVCVQPNGQILVGGTFVTLDPNDPKGVNTPTAIPYLARLNADGSVDTTFKPNPNNQVASIYVQANGKILVGGGFATLQPNGAASATADPYVARLNADGTIDTTFVNPGLNGQVLAINTQIDGDILLGGQFVYDAAGRRRRRRQRRHECRLHRAAESRRHPRTPPFPPTSGRPRPTDPGATRRQDPDLWPNHEDHMANLGLL